jgi:hypothetical protein
MAEDPRAQMAYRWAAQAHSLAWRRLVFSWSRTRSYVNSRWAATRRE